MSTSVFLTILAFYLIGQCMSHTYSSGHCPNVEPIHDFDMTKFLGRWYAMQKTTTESSCLIYDFKEGKKSGEYFLEQTSERYASNLDTSYVFNYSGKIRAEKNSSKMTIHFPLNVAGSASFDVVMTDYKTYAGIYTCQDVLFFKRQSATLLSRTNTIDPDVLRKMRHMFDEHISDLQLTPINHDTCNAADNQILVKVKSNLVSSINFSRAVPMIPNMHTSSKNADHTGHVDRNIADVSYEVEDISQSENAIEPRFNKDDPDVLWM